MDRLLIAKKLANHVNGTSRSDYEMVLEETNLTEDVDFDDVEALIAEGGAERCSGCEWWFSKLELFDTGSEYLCSDCKKYGS